MTASSGEGQRDCHQRLHALSATELLALYHRKAASPVEVTQAVLDHIAAWEPHLQATYALDAAACASAASASSA